MKVKLLGLLLFIGCVCVCVVYGAGYFERYYEHIDNEGIDITFDSTIKQLSIRNNGDYPVFCEFNTPMSSTLQLNQKIDDGEVYTDDNASVKTLYLKCNDGETTDVYISGKK